MTEWSDSDIVEACLAGDELAWRVLIERYSRLIYTIPLRFGLSKMAADEVFQETCLILLEKLGTLQDRHRLSSWLMTVSRRACIKRFRRRDRDLDASLVEEAIEDGSTKETLEDSLLRLEKRYLIHRAIERLSPRCQQLLKGLFFDHPPKSYREVAEELDIPLGGVGPTRARCLEKLHQEFVKLEKQDLSE
jgi:RNA polymerase sigma factor (sigma-70 family)